MKIQKVLDEFVKECSEKLDLCSIIQFGSSTYKKDFDDIDLLFVSNQDIIPTKEHFELIKIIKNFENKYKQLVFDFAGVADRKKSGNYSITTVFLGKKELSVEHNPYDLFFFKLLAEDKNIKTLYGKNPFKKTKIKLTNKHLFRMISVDLKKDVLRKSLDGLNTLYEGLYSYFKSILRAMLIHKRHFKKEELPEEFKKEYSGKIKLPKNAEKILNHKIKKEDFADILRFSEDCLKYLSK